MSAIKKLSQIRRFLNNKTPHWLPEWKQVLNEWIDRELKIDFKELILDDGKKTKQYDLCFNAGGYEATLRFSEIISWLSSKMVGHCVDVFFGDENTYVPDRISEVLCQKTSVPANLIYTMFIHIFSIFDLVLIGPKFRNLFPGNAFLLKSQHFNVACDPSKEMSQVSLLSNDAKNKWFLSKRSKFYQDGVLDSCEYLRILITKINKHQMKKIFKTIFRSKSSKTVKLVEEYIDSAYPREAKKKIAEKDAEFIDDLNFLFQTFNCDFELKTCILSNDDFVDNFDSIRGVMTTFPSYRMMENFQLVAETFIKQLDEILPRSVVDISCSYLSINFSN
jgi:hypothetical protein